MNYYDARQKRKSDSEEILGWHYTRMNDGKIWAVGDCVEHEPHATKLEAYECWTRYLLRERLRLDGVESGVRRQCEASRTLSDPCAEWTEARATVDNSWTWTLCDDHRNATVVAKLLGTVGAATSSW